MARGPPEPKARKSQSRGSCPKGSTLEWLTISPAACREQRAEAQGRGKAVLAALVGRTSRR